MLKTYIGIRTDAGLNVWVSCAPAAAPAAAAADESESGSYGYPIRWKASVVDEWGDLRLARALLVDLCGSTPYHERTDLHRALAGEVLAALPAERWVLTETDLVNWLAEAHSASIWRRRAAAEPALAEAWPWEGAGPQRSAVQHRPSAPVRGALRG